MSISRILVLSAAIATASLNAIPAKAESLLELLHPRNFIDGEAYGLADHCDTAWVLDYIKTRFDGKVRAYVGNDLFITEIRNPTLRHARPRDEEHAVGRQYCKATAMMTDRKAHEIYYTLEYPWGYAGNLTHVEFCIPGMDPEHVYGRLCSTVR